MKVAIIGSGNIGTDLMLKLLKDPGRQELVALAGIDPESRGLAIARERGVSVTHEGIDGLRGMPCYSDIALVYDATSAGAHRRHDEVLRADGKRVVDLTPAALGPFIVPPVNGDENIDSPNANMVTCGGQATIPMVAAVARVAPVRYAEIVASISSNSAGPGTRANIDEFTQTTARALEQVGTTVFTPEKKALLAGAVMAACDELDGLRDGIIMDPRRCTYDPVALQCKDADGPGCLTAEQVAVAQALYQGPQDSQGRALMPGAGALRGSELSWSGAGRLALAGGYLRYLAFAENPPKDWNWRDFDFDRDVSKVEAAAALYDPVAPNEAPDLGAFHAAGGKLLVYHGWADPGVSPFAMLDYYGQVTHREGGMDAVRDWFRVFMVPGMFHCRGGNVPNTFDMLTPIVNWVEKSVRPDGIRAEQRDEAGKLMRSRPLYAYPRYAEFTGGDPDKAESWAPAAPTGPVDDRDNDWIWAPKS